MTNLEGRVLRRRRALAPPAGVRDELWILGELARRLNSPSVFADDPETVFDELARASEGGLADYSGLSYARLDSEVPAYWPYGRGSTGTPRLFRDRFAHPDGLARLVAVTPAPSADPLHEDGALTLITGRLLEHYQTGVQTRRVNELVAAQPEARLQVHPATALRLGIRDGASVEIRNDRGTVRCRASVTPGIRQDTVFLPFHFPGDSRANILTSDATDPISGMPEFKTAAVHVRPLTEVRP